MSTSAAQPEPARSEQAGSEIRTRYRLSTPTFKTLSGIGRSPSRRQILQTACQAFEFRSFPIQQAEKALLREINDHSGIPYVITGESLAQPWHKVFLLVQTALARVPWPNKIAAAARRELLRESFRMYEILDKVLRCVVDILGERRDGRGVTVALDVLRSVKAKVWEGTAMELLQVEGIGLAKMQRLEGAGVRTVKQLAGLEFYHIERLLSRNPPFGHEVLSRVSGFPLLSMRIGRAEAANGGGAGGERESMGSMGGISTDIQWAMRVRLGYENEGLPTWCRRSPWVTLVMEGEDGRLLWFWRGSVKRLVGGKEMVIGVEGRKGEKVKATFACEEIVGTILRQEFDI